ncbi:MAG: 16S rRNA (uracil(1498)-N(3))-methyltransferase [Sedimentisphaerales bacterium]|nr:16S rRNA (uracil(1498)-N(3))-methyltransferase [Sedimentisphaerales bacterium]
MSTNRFFVEESSIEGNFVRLNAEQAHQICHVLRLEPGAALVVLDNAGFEYDVRLQEANSRQANGLITGKRLASGEPRRQITLFQSLLARDKFERVLQKGTEVGVSRFVPVQTDRSLMRAKQIDAKKITRWRRILQEAAEQSHRGRIPEIGQALALADALARFGQYDRVLIGALCDGSPTLREALVKDGRTPASVAILIGPEGGFTEQEVALAEEKGAVTIGLGPRILRTETAAMVLPALVLYELGEMEP